jgi:hypothetical protein
MFPLEQSLADWMSASLFDGGYFSPSRLGGEHLVYATYMNRPLLDLLIDGYSPTQPEWQVDSGEHPSAALFRHLRRYVASNPASWFSMNDHDDAYTAIEFVWPADKDDHWRSPLAWMQSHPAEQSGLCRQGLVFHDRTKVIEFRYQICGNFELWFCGSDSAFTAFGAFLKP